MFCNYQIHDELKNMNEPLCPFCDHLIAKVNKAVEPCCSEQNMETVNGMNTCINCGSVHGYDYVTEHFDFYDKMHMIRQKSVYNRKYHIENVIKSIYDIQLTYSQRDKIYKVFIEINSVLHKVNDGRKRMISTKFILKQLFQMLELPYKDIQVTKNIKKLKDYEKYWEKVQSLIGDRIQSIINK